MKIWKAYAKKHWDDLPPDLRDAYNKTKKNDKLNEAPPRAPHFTRPTFLPAVAPVVHPAVNNPATQNQNESTPS
jgi:hypothetical protein